MVVFCKCSTSVVKLVNKHFLQKSFSCLLFTNIKIYLFNILISIILDETGLRSS